MLALVTPQRLTFVSRTRGGLVDSILLHRVQPRRSTSASESGSTVGSGQSSDNNSGSTANT